MTEFNRTHVPRVSIGMPVYNGEKYLREAVTSLLTQDYTDFELIIADNASTDGTEVICRAFADRDPRIRYFRNPVNVGASANFSAVFDLARGEFFKWACADDMHYPGNLRRCADVLATAPPDVVLVTPRAFLIDEEGRSLIDENGFVDLRIGYGPNVPGPERLSTAASSPSRRLAEVLPRLRWQTAQFGLFRRNVLARTRKIDAFYASDRVLLVEIALLGKIIEIDAPLFARRQHAEISTSAHKDAGAYARWMNPGATAKRRRIMSLEYARSIRRLPLSPLERVLSLGVVFQVWLKQKIERTKHVSLRRPPNP